MKRLHLTKREFRVLSPSLLALWLVGLIGGVSVATPVLRQVPELSDQDAFEPGAMLLAETVRLHRTGLVDALGRSVLIFLFAQLALLLIRSRLFCGVVATSTGRATGRSVFSRLPQFLGVSLLQALGYAAIVFVTAKAWGQTPPLAGALPPNAVLAKGLVLCVGAFSLLLTSVAFDLWRLSLYHPDTHQRLRWCARTLASEGRALLSVRAARATAAGLLGFAVLQISAQPIVATAGALTLVVGQGAALLALILEAWWLVVAHRALLMGKE